MAGMGSAPPNCLQGARQPPAAPHVLLTLGEAPFLFFFSCLPLRSSFRGDSFPPPPTELMGLWVLLKASHQPQDHPGGHPATLRAAWPSGPVSFLG